MYAGVEAGGTKFIVGLGTGPHDIVERAIIPTTTPDETIARVIAWFAERPRAKGLGLASFGPLRIDPRASDRGTILNTPKPGWSNVALGPRLAEALQLPIEVATDVSGAAMGEWRWGAARGARLAVYVTVGTGLGGGMVLNGHPVDNHHHAEMGHLFPRRHPADPDFPGVCPFHQDCLEGLASGPAIVGRWGKNLSGLGEDHVAYDILADYLAQLVTTMRATFSPDRIVLGGGVCNAPLIERVRERAKALANGYFVGDIDRMVALSPLSGDSGLLGAIALAELAHERATGGGERDLRA